jgi:hypothetical protein|nr:MAG TPA: hypothetical protein [Caudoviricetes sp.]
MIINQVYKKKVLNKIQKEHFLKKRENKSYKTLDTRFKII